MLRRFRCVQIFLKQRYDVCIMYCYVCVCVFSSQSFWTSSSLDVPAGVTQEGHTGFFIHLPSAVRALIFLARRIQPFLSLVDRELIVLHSLGIFCGLFSKNPVYRDRTHVPTCQKVKRLPLSYRGDRLVITYTAGTFNMPASYQ